MLVHCGHRRGVASSSWCGRRYRGSVVDVDLGFNGMASGRHADLVVVVVVASWRRHLGAVEALLSRRR